MTQYHNPISFKGVLFLNQGVVLLKNQRDEWELPGGRRSKREDPADCVRREFLEETAIEVVVGPVLDVWIYYGEGLETTIVTFGCWPSGPGDDIPERSEEHQAIGVFGAGDIDRLTLPQGYRESIEAWQSDVRRNLVVAS